MLLVIALEPTTSVTDEKSPRTEDKQEKPLAVVDQPDHRLGDANGKTCFIFLFMLSALQMHSSRCLHSLPPLSPLSPPLSLVRSAVELLQHNAQNGLNSHSITVFGKGHQIIPLRNEIMLKARHLANGYINNCVAGPPRAC